LKTPLRGHEAESLNRLVDLTRWARPSDVHHLLSRFAWPIEVFGEGREIHAYTMPKAPQSCYFDMTIISRLADRSRPGQVTETRRTKREPLQLKYLIDDSWWQGQQVSSQKPEVSFEQRIDIAIDCCDSVLVLHSHGLVYGDISANNVVARREILAGSYFFDADSISSVDFRAAESLVSPGWETPVGLDPLGIDRSRCALVVLRLMTERLNARPNDHPSTFASDYVVTTLLPVLKECYLRGDESSFLELVRTLRSLRSIPHGDEVFTHALDTGFARLVLREQAHGRTSSHQVVIEQAKNQVIFEEQVDQSIGLEHRRLVRRSRVRVGQFKLDVSPRLELLRNLTSDSDLMDLIYEAQFQDIVNHLVATGLASLEGHPAILRVVEHAHLEIDLPTPTIAVQPGKAQVDLLWPREEFVNCLRLRIRIGNDLQDLVVERQRGDQRVTRIVSAPRGSDLQISAIFGSRSKGGTDYFPSFGRTLTSVIPPVPAPPRPTVTGNNSGRTPVVTQQSLDVTIIDPEAERREQARLEAEFAAKRRRRNYSILGAAAVLAVSLIGYFALRPDSEFISLTQPQAAEAPFDWGQFSDGVPLVEVQRSSNTITFAWPVSRFAPSYRFQYSYDGRRWSRPTVVDPLMTPVSTTFEFYAESTPPLHLIESTDSRGNVLGRQFINILHGTGFATYPKFLVTSSGVQVTATSTSLPGEPIPVGFLVEATIDDGRRPVFTVRERANGSVALIDNRPGRSYTSVRVRSIFGPNQFGPWIGINL